MKKNEMDGACGTCGGKKEVNTGVLLGKPERKRQLGRPKNIWESNIKTDI
jgi:hypothetical protein